MSWNFGAEGPTRYPEIRDLRNRQVKNFATILLLADGVPMILAGDEFGRTQHGNNNAYCQDNEISWIDWKLPKLNAGLHRLFQLLIASRRRHSLLRPTSYLSLAGKAARKIEWHGVRLGEPDWSHESRSLAMHLSGMSGSGSEDHIYFIANAHWESHDFELPNTGLRWRRFVDTSLNTPDDITDLGAEEPLVDDGHYRVAPRATVVLIGRSNGHGTPTL